MDITKTTKNGGMNVNLQEQIEELEARESDILSQDTIDQEQLRIVRNRLNELRHELEQQQKDAEVVAQVEQAHQDRVVQSMNSIANGLDNMVAGGFPLRTLFVGEGEYQLGRIAIQRWAEERESINLNTIKGNEEQIAQLQRQNDLLQQRIKEADSENDQLKTELADTQQKRDAAARELADAQAQLAQIKAQNDELTKQITAVRLGANPLDPEEQAKRQEEEKAAGEKLRRERYTVYDLKPDRELNPTKYTAKRAFDNSDVEFPVFALKAYTVLTSDNEVQDFRTQYAPQSDPQAAIHDQPLDVPPVPEVTLPEAQFPVGMGPDEISAPSAVSEGTGTNDPEARISALEAQVSMAHKRLERLEKQAGLNALEVA